MKIAMMGFSGSGKSTLTRYFSKTQDLPSLHLDQIQFIDNWKLRDRDEARQLVTHFLDENSSWVIDGNYSDFLRNRRVKEADMIIIFMYSPWRCLYRVLKRSHKYRGQVRPDMARGCIEQLDFSFIWWVLYKGRKQKSFFLSLKTQHPEKVVILKRPKDLENYFNQIIK